MRLVTKIGAVMLCLILSVSLFAACGNNQAPAAPTAPAANANDAAAPSGEAAASGGKTTITYWNGFTGPDGEVLQELVKRYNETNDKNVEVQVDIMPWDSLWQKLSTVLSVGQGPDILAFATERTGTYAGPGALAAIDDIYTSGLVDASLVPAALDENLKYQGKYYGVPMNFATLLLYYNKDIFEAAGLDPEAPPKSWDELEQYALQIVEKTGNYGYGMATAETIPMWPIMFWGNGGDFIVDGKNVFNSPENVETLTRWSALIRDKKIAPPTMTGGEIDKLFETQKLGMYYCGPWATGGFANAGVNFGVAQPVAGPKGAVTLGTGVGMYMTSSSKNKDAVYDFFSYWNTKDVQVEWSLGSGFPLARTDAVDDPRLNANPYIAEFSKPANEAKFYLQQLTNFAEIDSQAIIPVYEHVMLENKDPKAALDEAAAAIEALLQ